MDRKDLFKGRDDFGRVVSGDISYNKFDVLREYAQRLKKDITTNKECYDYILKEVVKENENIKSLLIWNQKRIDLLNEIGKKINLLINKMSNVNDDIFDIILKDV